MSENNTVPLSKKLAGNYIKLYSEFEEYIKSREELKKLERERERERVLKCLNDMPKWKFTKMGVKKFNIPACCLWMDIYNCRADFEREFYEEIINENNLQIVNVSVLSLIYTVVYMPPN